MWIQTMQIILKYTSRPHKFDTFFGCIHLDKECYDMNALFSILHLTFTLLLDEINVCLTTLCGFHFQSVGPTLFLPNKKVNARKSAQKRILLTFLSITLSLDVISEATTKKFLHLDIQSSLPIFHLLALSFITNSFFYQKNIISLFIRKK